MNISSPARRNSNSSTSFSRQNVKQKANTMSTDSDFCDTAFTVRLICVFQSASEKQEPQVIDLQNEQSSQDEKRETPKQTRTRGGRNKVAQGCVREPREKKLKQSKLNFSKESTQVRHHSESAV